MDLAQWRTAEARQQHRAPEGAEGNGVCELDFSHFIRKSFVGVAEVVSLCEVVRLRRVVCAPRRLPLHSSLPPRAACITSLTERHYLAHGDTLLLLVCLPLLSEDIVVQ